MNPDRFQLNRIRHMTGTPKFLRESVEKKKNIKCWANRNQVLIAYPNDSIRLLICIPWTKRGRGGVRERGERETN